MLLDAERLIGVWNGCQARCCPACRIAQAVDLRGARPTAVTGLIPALSCRSGRPNPPFAELVLLSPMSIADEIREERAGANCGTRRVEGHHEDYNDHLAVTWLCRGCHRAQHDRELHLLDWGGQVGNTWNPR